MKVRVKGALRVWGLLELRVPGVVVWPGWSWGPEQSGDGDGGPWAWLAGRHLGVCSRVLPPVHSPWVRGGVATRVRTGGSRVWAALQQQV